MRFIESFSRKRGKDPRYFIGHPQEDYLLISKRYPIYVVADGVTLLQWIIEDRPYPHPSPAGEVARIFCEAAVKAAEADYAAISSPEDIRRIFKIGNEAVAEFEVAHGRTKETVDYWTTDFFAATAALAVVKDGVVYWGSICDSYVAHIDSNGNLIEPSPLCDSLKEAEPPPYEGDPNDLAAYTRYRWSTTRNSLNAQGKRIGYGVITGEPEALAYVAAGHFTLASGERLLVFTDGFEEYVTEPDFLALLHAWPDDIKARVRQYGEAKIPGDPERFGHERSLIAVAF